MHRIVYLFVFLVISSATTAPAKTWMINPGGTGAAPHIAAAVDSCNPGDTIRLTNGTFNGPNNRQITVGKSIVICSVNGPSFTTIDCQRLGMAFDFVGAQSSELKDVTIAWSWTQPGEHVPVWVRSSAALVVNDCVFRNGRGAEVGAIDCVSPGSLDVSDCEFRDNFGVIGTGAVRSNGVLSNIRNCWFESNGSNGGHGAISVSNPTFTSVVEYNTIWNNTGGQGGAGAFLRDSVAPETLRFRHNTLVGNTGHPSLSGAVQVIGDYIIIDFNIIAFNNVQALWCHPLNIHASVVQCNNIFGNTGGDVLCPDMIGGNNLYTDPYFCGAANGEFTIDEASPSAPANNGCGVLFGAWPTDCRVVGIGDAVPGGEYKLLGNAPNPFNPETVIRYNVPRAAAVTLEIFDVSGALVRTFTREHVSGGVKQLVWDGRDDRGRLVATGVYVYRMTAPSFKQSSKMLLLK